MWFFFAALFEMVALNCSATQWCAKLGSFHLARLPHYGCITYFEEDHIADTTTTRRPQLGPCPGQQEDSEMGSAPSLGFDNFDASLRIGLCRSICAQDASIDNSGSVRQLLGWSHDSTRCMCVVNGNDIYELHCEERQNDFNGLSSTVTIIAGPGTGTWQPVPHLFSTYKVWFSALNMLSGFAPFLLTMILLERLTMNRVLQDLLTSPRWAGLASRSKAQGAAPRDRTMAVPWQKVMGSGCRWNGRGRSQKRIAPRTSRSSSTYRRIAAW